mmetsp:Transcript_17810/g.15571  ORF Transcript_17810/g.15571 Transcript_17810/m.15571 type:complete len:150 (-) Transcript_17810:72-521(-)
MIYLACDHAGYNLKEYIKKVLQEKNLQVTDLGTNSLESVHYPQFGSKLCESVQKDNSFGILCCGSGTGISIVANKYKGIRCSICNDLYVGLEGIKNDSPNVIAFGERVIGKGAVKQMIEAFLNTEIVEDEEFKARQKKIEEIENANLLN